MHGAAWLSSWYTVLQTRPLAAIHAVVWKVHAVAADVEDRCDEAHVGGCIGVGLVILGVEMGR